MRLMTDLLFKCNVEKKKQLLSFVWQINYFENERKTKKKRFTFRLL